MGNGSRFAWMALMFLPLAVGCNSRFAGEWVHESVIDRDGVVTPLIDQRRTAMQFIPPSTVRIGFYSDASRAVDADSVSSSDYQTIQNRSVAEFGAYTARVEDGQLVTYLGSKPVGIFQRLRGKSVFPPLIPLPRFVDAGTPGEGTAGPVVAVSDRGD